MSEMYLALQAAKPSNHRSAGNTMRQIASPDRREASCPSSRREAPEIRSTITWWWARRPRPVQDLDVVLRPECDLDLAVAVAQVPVPDKAKGCCP
jgi:hypothetical protein